MTNHIETLREMFAVCANERRMKEADALEFAIGAVEWLPVSERLPIDAATFAGVYETVNVLAFDGRRVAEVVFCAGNGAGKPWASFGQYEELAATRITHWRPLPPPPAHILEGERK